MPWLLFFWGDHAIATADDEGFVALEKVAHHLFKGFRPLGADFMARIVDEYKLAAGQNLLVVLPHLRRHNPVPGSKQHENRRFQCRHPASSSCVSIRLPQSRRKRRRLGLNLRVGSR